MGVLVTNGKINSDYLGGKARVGPRISRQFFFPNAANSNDDFVNIYGDAAAVSEGLRNLVVCQSTLQLYHGVYVAAIKTDLGRVAENSLTGGSAPVYTEPYPTGSMADLSRFTAPAGACGDSCKFEVVKPVKGYLNIRGTLLIKNAQGATVHYGVPESSVELSLFQNEAGKEAYIAVGSYDANGNFLVQAPYIQNAAYKAVLHVTDKAGQYQSNLVDILVNPPNANSDLNVGTLLLTSNTGAGCKQVDLKLTNDCFASLAGQSATATLKANLHDIINVGEELQYPLTLTVRRGFSEVSPVVHTEVLSQPTWSKSLPVDYYSLSVSGGGYADNVQRVTLDSNQSADFYLEKKMQSGYRIYAAIDNTVDPNSDYDLNLKMRSADGKECVVSPANRICPFATHVQSISNNQKGFEVIELSRFTNAYYMVYLTKNPSLSGNCPFANTTAKRFLARKDNHLIDWTANPAVRIFTTLGSSLFGPSQSGFLGSSSYSEASKQMLNPIKYGEQTVIPNLFSAIGSSGYSYPAPALFSQYVDNTDAASVFGASMPLLYPQNDVRAQVDAVRNSNAPSSYLSNFASWANSNNPTSAQDFVVASVFGQISGVNDNKNELIREENDLKSGFNYYNTFDNTSYNTIGGFMSNFPGWDTGVQGVHVPGWTGANLINNAQPVVVQTAPVVETIEVPAPVVVQPAPVVQTIEVPAPVVVQPAPVVQTIEVPAPVVVQPAPVVQTIEVPAPVVVQPAPVVETVEVTAPVIVQPRPAPVVQTVLVTPPEDNTPLTTPPQPAPVGLAEPDIVVVESAPVDYTGAIKSESAYQYSVNLKPDGTYPLNTDLIPEKTVVQVFRTTTDTVASPTNVVNVQPVEQVTPVPLPVLSYPQPVVVPVVQTAPTDVVITKVETAGDVRPEAQPNETYNEGPIQVSSGDSITAPLASVNGTEVQDIPDVGEENANAAAAPAAEFVQINQAQPAVVQQTFVDVAPAPVPIPVVSTWQTEQVVQPVAEPVQEISQPVVETYQQVTQPFVQTVPVVAQTVYTPAEVVPDVTQTVTEVTTPVTDAYVAPVVETVAQQTTEPVVIVDTPQPIEPVLIPTIVAPAAPVVQTFTETTQDVVQPVYQTTTQTVQSVADAPQQFVETFTDNTQPIVTETVQPVVNNVVVQNLVQPEPVVQSVIDNTPVVQTVTDYPQQVVQTVTEYPQQVVQTVTDNTPVVQTVIDNTPVVQTVTDYPQQVVQTVTDYTQPITQTVTEAPQQVVQTFTDNTPVVQTITEAPQQVVQTVTDYTQPITQTVTEYPQQVVQTVTDNTPVLTTVNPQITDSVTQYVTQPVTQTVTQTVTEVPHQVVQTFTDNTPVVQTVQVSSPVQTVNSQITDSVTQYVTQPVTQTVTDTTSSIANGVNGATQTVTDTVADSASAIANQIIPDRRLQKGRLLQATPSTYTTQFCFTGFGERSIKPISTTGTGVPSIQPCQELYPDSDSYSLKNLKPALN